jgi:hypothetical protein
MDHSIFDPVITTVSIICQVHWFAIPARHLFLGIVFAAACSNCFILRDYHITTILMQQACWDAYPDPDHYMRIHIPSILSHSNYVFAAVCLKMGGMDDNDIAIRIRWTRASAACVLALVVRTVHGAITNSLF